MHELAQILVLVGALSFSELVAARSADADALTIVDVPQGMILQTELTGTGATTPRAGSAIEFVVTHDLRVGTYVVIPAGSRGAGHITRLTRGAWTASASHIACDYVMASDGTRIPVSGSLPYLTTRASRAVVIFGTDASPALP